MKEKHTLSYNNINYFYKLKNNKKKFYFLTIIKLFFENIKLSFCQFYVLTFIRIFPIIRCTHIAHPTIDSSSHCSCFPGVNWIRTGTKTSGTTTRWKVPTTSSPKTNSNGATAPPTTWTSSTLNFLHCANRKLNVN